ncbi:C40 family peptidase [Arthrobacter sp. fls2-241-R2A-200]|uniref:C40 family peptidase n=1 Tax=Arthrobacter sp. fls2-241-R2A-200 TaxID=3040281 RepID=UPI00254D5393|nr:C40 family peptidase [Arthrobacter sp. fls2-241-R2A-200]
MSSRTTPARHRAQAVRKNPLNTLSTAVSSNAGTVGRQAVVLAAASGLILSVGLPAQAADTGVSASEASGTQQMVATAVVTAEPTATVAFESPVVATQEAPKVVQAVAETPDASTQAATGATNNAGTSETVTAQSAVAKDGVSSAAASGLAAIAYTGIGHPYVWGGTTPNGWDCSGFTQWVYAQAGISIPRTNAWTVMKPTNTPAPGDLVMQNGGAHVGIYVGNGMMISALNPSQGTLLHAAAATGTSSFFTLR